MQLTVVELCGLLYRNHSFRNSQYIWGPIIRMCHVILVIQTFKKPRLCNLNRFLDIANSRCICSYII